MKHLLNSFESKKKQLAEFIKKYSNDTNYSEWEGFIGGNKNTVKSFLSTASTALKMLGNKDIAKLTTSNDINFDELRNTKTIVYLQIPQQELETYSFLLNLFYSRFFNSCFQSNQENALPVYCLIDEAGHTAIPNLATIITTIRKYNVSISLVLQSLSQLETSYGKNQADTILNGGIDSQIYFTGLDLETCQRLEKILGTVTTEEIDKNGVKQEKTKPLMDSQTIMRMHQNRAIYLFKNHKPILLNLKPYFKDIFFNKYSKMTPYKLAINENYKEVEYIKLDEE